MDRLEENKKTYKEIQKLLEKIIEKKKSAYTVSVLTILEAFFTKRLDQSLEDLEILFDK